MGGGRGLKHKILANVFCARPLMHVCSCALNYNDHGYRSLLAYASSKMEIDGQGDRGHRAPPDQPPLAGPGHPLHGTGPRGEALAVSHALSLFGVYLTKGHTVLSVFRRTDLSAKARLTCFLMYSAMGHATGQWSLLAITAAARSKYTTDRRHANKVFE